MGERLYPWGSQAKVNCCPSHVKAKRSLSSDHNGVIKNMSLTSIVAVIGWAFSCIMVINSARLGTVAVKGSVLAFSRWKSIVSHHVLLGFLTGHTGEYKGQWVFMTTPCSCISCTPGLIPSLSPRGRGYCWDEFWWQGIRVGTAVVSTNSQKARSLTSLHCS